MKQYPHLEDRYTDIPRGNAVYAMSKKGAGM